MRGWRGREGGWKRERESVSGGGGEEVERERESTYFYRLFNHRLFNHDGYNQGGERRCVCGGGGGGGVSNRTAKNKAIKRFTVSKN